MIQQDTGGNPPKPAGVSQPDYDFLMNRKEEGMSFDDAKAALVKVKQSYLKKQSPLVSQVMGTTQGAQTAAATGRLEGVTPYDQTQEAKDKAKFRPGRMAGEFIEETVGEIPVVGKPLEYAAKAATLIPRKAADYGAATLGAAAEGVGEMAGGVKDMYGVMKEGAKDLLTAEGTDKTTRELAAQSSRGMSRIVGGALGTAFSPVTAAIEETAIGRNIAKPVMEAPFKALEYGITKGYKAAGYDTESPQFKESVLAPLMNAANLGLIVAGPKIAKRASETKVYKYTTDQAKKAINSVKNLSPKEAISNLGGRGLAIDMVDSTNKLMQKDALKFQEMTGKRPAEKLVEWDIIKPPEQTAAALLEKWQKAKANLDAGVVEIKGTYKNRAIEQMAEALNKKKAGLQSSKGRADYKLSKNRLKKLEEGGLTMKEIMELKRQYEREVKVDYLKENLPDKIAEATDLDAAVREFVYETAKEKGFNNLAEISRDIRDAHFLADKIGDQFIKQKMNNMFGLTDNLLLVGGVVNPASLAVLGLKKFVSLPSVKMAVARKLKGSTPAVESPKAPLERIKLKSKQTELQKAKTEQ